MVNHGIKAQKERDTTTIYSTIDASINHITHYISTCYLSFFSTKPNSGLSQKLCITQKWKECSELINSQHDAMLAIREALHTSRTDIRTSYQETTRLLTSYPSQYTIQQSIESYERGFEYRANMLEQLSEQLNSYPELPEDDASLDELNSFYTKRDHHHLKVMELVEKYLPETYAALKETQLVLKNTN